MRYFYFTKRPIEHKQAGTLHKFWIPEGTPCVPVDNLPKSGFWVVGPWDDMGDEAESVMRNCGILLGADEVEENCMCAFCEGYR
jgi:hypothetical protein